MTFEAKIVPVSDAADRCVAWGSHPVELSDLIDPVGCIASAGGRPVTAFVLALDPRLPSALNVVRFRHDPAMPFSLRQLATMKALRLMPETVAPATTANVVRLVLRRSDPPEALVRSLHRSNLWACSKVNSSGWFVKLDALRGVEAIRSEIEQTRLTKVAAMWGEDVEGA